MTNWSKVKKIATYELTTREQDKEALRKTHGAINRGAQTISQAARSAGDSLYSIARPISRPVLGAAAGLAAGAILGADPAEYNQTLASWADQLPAIGDWMAVNLREIGNAIPYNSSTIPNGVAQAMEMMPFEYAPRAAEAARTGLEGRLPEIGAAVGAAAGLGRMTVYR